MTTQTRPGDFKFHPDVYKLRCYGSVRAVRLVEKTGKRAYIAFFRRPGVIDAALVKQSDLTYRNDDEVCTAAAVHAPPVDDCEAVVADLKRNNKRTTDRARDQKHKPGSGVYLDLTKSDVSRKGTGWGRIDQDQRTLDSVFVKIADAELVAAGGGPEVTLKRGEVLVAVPTQDYIDAQEAVRLAEWRFECKQQDEVKAKYGSYFDAPTGDYGRRTAEKKVFRDAEWAKYDHLGYGIEYVIVKRAHLRLTSKGASFAARR